MESQKNTQKSLFSPDKQNEFWGKVSPDVRGLLQFFELKENWTLKYEDLPEFYGSIEKVIQTMQDHGKNKHDEDLIDKLIVLFGSMPLRQCVAGFSWIDKNIEKNTDIQWVSNMYFRSADISIDGHADKDVEKHAYVIKERVELIARINLINKLFTSIKM